MQSLPQRLRTRAAGIKGNRLSGALEAWKDLVYRASNVGRGGHGLVQKGGPKDGHEMQCHHGSCQASANGKSVKGERAQS